MRQPTEPNYKRGATNHVTSTKQKDKAPDRAVRAQHEWRQSIPGGFADTAKNNRDGLENKNKPLLPKTRYLSRFYPCTKEHNEPVRVGELVD